MRICYEFLENRVNGKTKEICWFFLDGHPCKFVTRGWSYLLNSGDLRRALCDYCESVYRNSPHFDVDDIPQIAKQRLLSDFIKLFKGHTRELVKVSQIEFGGLAMSILSDDKTHDADTIEYMENQLQCLQNNH